MVLVVGLPGDVDDLSNRVADTFELWIVEALAQSRLELLARQLDVTLPLANDNLLGHVVTLSASRGRYAARGEFEGPPGICAGKGALQQQV